jgi:hypothetical protein
MADPMDLVCRASSASTVLALAELGKVHDRSGGAARLDQPLSCQNMLNETSPDEESAGASRLCGQWISGEPVATLVLGATTAERGSGDDGLASIVSRPIRNEQRPAWLPRRPNPSLPPRRFRPVDRRLANGVAVDLWVAAQAFMISISGLRV